MSSFQLPSAHPDLFQHIQVQLCNSPPDEAICHSLTHYLKENKERIHKRDQEWDIYKKYTNPYEYIHTSVLLPSSVRNNRHTLSSISNTMASNIASKCKRKCVAKYKPLSRSFFKMVEMIRTFNLFGDFQQQAISTFHLAEGPGGFIEATCMLRNNPSDQYHGMTIIEDPNDGNVPAWKKSGHLLQKYSNIQLEYGLDGTGNLLNADNFAYCAKKYAASMDIITADGGFDFSVDFNNQEVLITKLIWAQMCYAIAMQKPGGHFILKAFDCVYQHTIDMLYILASFYEEVHIVKLKTSRIGNSEKYIVCKRFRNTLNYYHYFPKLYAAFEPATMTNEQYIARFLTINVPRLFLNKLEDINYIMGQQQIENIHYTMHLVERNTKPDKIEELVKHNITKCVRWCIENGLECNTL